MTRDSSCIDPVCTIRTYSGEACRHEHNHAQIMMPLQGRMDLEISGRSLFTDTSCGMVVPAGAAHCFEAQAGTRMLVIDAPEQAGLERLRRFAITPSCRALVDMGDVARQLSVLLQLPLVLARRGIDLGRLDAALDGALHEDWAIARMASLFFLSPQRFHARLRELTGMTPGAYLRKRRLDAAVKAIARGVPLELAALDVGYRSASALAFALSRDRQVGARELRRQAGGRTRVSR